MTGSHRSRRRSGMTSACPVLSDPRPAARRSRRGLPRLAGHPGLERRFSGRRLAAYFGVARVRSGDQAARGQGKRHSAAARHPAAHGGRIAENSAGAEGARLSHRPCGAGDTGAAGDADRTAAMAVASDRRRPWRFRIGQKFVISFSPRPTCFPPPRCPIWTGVTQVDGACGAVRRRQTASARRSAAAEQTPWPQPSPLALASAAIALPVPAQSIFEIRGKSARDSAVAASVLTSCGANRPGAAPTRWRLKADRSQRRHVPGQAPSRRPKPGASRFAGRANRNTAGAHRGALRHLVQVKKRRSA